VGSVQNPNAKIPRKGWDEIKSNSLQFFGDAVAPGEDVRWREYLIKSFSLRLRRESGLFLAVSKAPC